MAGLIRDEDIALVRERVRIDEVVEQYVTLRNAGGGSRKGLCPFHDEKTPSFTVTPGRGYWHCLSGETEVLTAEGTRPIRELAGGVTRILNAEANWVDAPFYAFGPQPLLALSVTRNRQRKVIHATSEHRWFVRHGELGQERREVLTRDLSPGDRLAYTCPRSSIRRSSPSPVGNAHGFTFGDRSLRDTGPVAVLDPPDEAALGWVVESVEGTDRVEEVYCAVVEQGHAFVLADNILTGNCFGCSRGGDVISFLQEVEGLTFVEAVERLAVRVGVELRYTEGGGPSRQGERGQRRRLVEAHRIAAEFYAAQLAESPDAVAGRQFLAERGFDREAADRFGVGFAPRTGEALLRHLRGRGVRDDDAVAAGLAAESARGPYDRFRGRLLWPIRELSGEVVGFGARRLFDDDRIDTKYLNSPETPIYKKSRLLYGVDLARREIARASQAVVVEGYTDVMACHVAGVPTAVATCGTAFGPDHAKILRRLLLDHDEFRGEVIFTFDGDEPGRQAALKAYEGDSEFGGQTYVAVQPDGLDPCDLRLQKGDAAVRELVATRVPLYRFVLRNVVDRYDLDRADGRVDAVRAAARLVTSVRDRSKVSAFVRELSDMVGADPDDVRAEIRRGGGHVGPRPGRSARAAEPDPAAPTLDEVPDVREPRFADEREALKAVVQHPQLAAAVTELDGSDFDHPVLRAVWVAVTAEPLPTAADPAWLATLTRRLPEPARPVLAALAVDPLHTQGEVEARYVDALLARLQEITAARRIEELKSRLQRTSPVEHELDYNRMFGELVVLEQHRRQLRERAIGGGAA